MEGREMTKTKPSNPIVPFQTVEEPAPIVKSGNYEPVRFNALKHGILSKLAVLAHEDHAEFADLLAALIDEHRPSGMTERHLIEELATIIWRKRRVLLAEGAKINEGLKNAASSSKSVMASAAPFERKMASETTDVRDLLDLTLENVASSTRHLIWQQQKKQRRSCVSAGRMPMRERGGH
jgi:hypothetical protein